MLNAFTVDLEDWYQGIGIPSDNWHLYEKRLAIGHGRLMNLLSKYNVKATFFVLGKVIEEYPELIRELIDEGHEIGCHSYSHTELFNLTSELFEKEIEQCNELIKPYKKDYLGFRAPYFSVDKRSWWTLDVLKKYHFTYDASIYPGDSKRTGIVGYRKDIHALDGFDLWEAPVSTFKLFNFDFALGGAYFRILPYDVFSKKMKAINKERPAIFYIHPWELDPGHPYLSSLSARRRLPHYWNLKKTEERLDKLLRDFEFGTLINIINKNKSDEHSNRN
jgi:polysaccharide deacetylase family protein (PEP-CTERM system associated)